MGHVDAIYKAVEFIENHLDKTISIADVADAIYYSLFHFCRCFNLTAHITPYDYLIRRRLTESAGELLTTSKKIIDIAYDYQFNSPETYTRAFKRMFTIRPSQYRKLGQADVHCSQNRLTRQHLVHFNQGSYLKPVFSRLSGFTAAGIMTGLQTAADPAALAANLKQLTAGYHMPGDEQYLGIYICPPGLEQIFYMAAIKGDSQALSLDSLVYKKLESQQYIRFIHKGKLNQLNLTRDYIYQIWLPKSGQKLNSQLELHFYRSQLPLPADKEQEIEIFIPLAL